MSQSPEGGSGAFAAAYCACCACLIEGGTVLRDGRTFCSLACVFVTCSSRQSDLVAGDESQIGRFHNWPRSEEDR